MHYFRYFPETPYTIVSGNTTFDAVLTQISARAIIAAKLRQNISVIYDYMILGDERPDNVAEAVYGGPQYTWVILLLNNISSLFDWPLTTQEFTDYVISKYGSVQAAQTQRVYHTTDGLLVDAVTYGLLGAKQGSVTSQFDEELILNDNKRRIKIVPSEFIPVLQKELTTLFT